MSMTEPWQRRTLTIFGQTNQPHIELGYIVFFRIIFFLSCHKLLLLGHLLSDQWDRGVPVKKWQSVHFWPSSLIINLYINIKFQTDLFLENSVSAYKWLFLKNKSVWNLIFIY